MSSLLRRFDTTLPPSAAIGAHPGRQPPMLQEQLAPACGAFVCASVCSVPVTPIDSRFCTGTVAQTRMTGNVRPTSRVVPARSLITEHRLGVAEATLRGSSNPRVQQYQTRKTACRSMVSGQQQSQVASPTHVSQPIHFLIHGSRGEISSSEAIFQLILFLIFLRVGSIGRMAPLLGIK